MFFASDNWAGAHPAITASLSAAAGGFDPAYGSGAHDKAIADRFNEIFEREVAVFFVATGTAANSLSLASVTRPGGVSFCHREAHIVEDECGAPEYLSGGSRLFPVDGPSGKMDIDRLKAAVQHFSLDNVHGGWPTAISITQATEIGTIHSLDEIDAISAIAKEHSLALHMDGARFANALVSLDVSPAEMTWKRGVDMLSFGGTKNGCWCAEAVVLFDTAKAAEFAFIRKRAAQLFSKSRFVAAQFEAYLKDDLWLHTARHANAMASALADAISKSSNMHNLRLAWQPQANEVFAIMPKQTVAQLQEAGAKFYDWHVPASFSGAIAEDEELTRFVTSFATREEDVAQFRQLIASPPA